MTNAPLEVVMTLSITTRETNRFAVGQARHPGQDKAYADAYGEQHFVRVRQEYVNTKWVRDTNYCDLSARLVGEGPSRKVVVFSAIDNMIKGASGQAVQNMNLMFNLDQTAGLR